MTPTAYPSLLSPDFCVASHLLVSSGLLANGSRMRSRFFVIEGVDGSGKTSLANALAGYLASDPFQKGWKAEALRQPGGTPLGEILRTALKTPEQPVSPNVRLLLMEASRTLTAERIKARRDAGDDTWFVLDRFSDSGRVYQGLEGVPEDVMSATSSLYENLVPPTLTFYLKVSPEEAFRRLNQREGTGPRDAYDDSSVERLAEIIRRYETRVMRSPGQYYVIDASLSLQFALDQAKWICGLLSNAAV